MFITDRVLDLIVKTKDSCFEIALGAKENEIRYLKNTLEKLEEELSYERHRADALCDRLLVRDARVASVSPAAVELAKHKDEVAVKALRETFEGLNDVGEIPPPTESRAFSFAGGGSAVAHK